MMMKVVIHLTEKQIEFLARIHKETQGKETPFNPDNTKLFAKCFEEGLKRYGVLYSRSYPGDIQLTEVLEFIEVDAVINGS